MLALSPHICPEQIRLYHIQLSAWSLGFCGFLNCLSRFFLLSILSFWSSLGKSWSHDVSGSLLHF